MTASENAAAVRYAPAFSTVYVEEAAAGLPRTKEILSKLPKATVIPCKSYREIFNRPHQEPTRQKHAPALILAVGQPPFLYDGAPVCQDFGNRHFYYTSGVMNCIFDCEYCYLQGMYNSGHIVVFVNLEDTFAALDEILKEHEAYVCISYDTDLLALEPLLGMVKAWMDFAKDRAGLTLELRTKSASESVLRKLPALPNVILALTLSPEPVIAAYEHRTPPLTARLHMANTALSLGWPVRLCFDPMLAVHNAADVYNAMFDTVIRTVPMAQIRDASIGVFRISGEYLRRMRRCRTSAVTCYPYELRDGVYAYPPDIAGRLLSLARERLAAVLPEDRLFFWETESSQEVTQ
ncbi:MAG: radical SAM protein [Lachnospiraceae bacterium]|nr:radical SAM protein [Lachnospiraceae bacterium]